MAADDAPVPADHPLSPGGGVGQHDSGATNKTDSMSEAEDRQLLRAGDTAIIEATGTRLVFASDVAAMALVCEAIAADPDAEVGETLLWVMSRAWKSGDVDVPSLLLAVEAEHEGDARAGADQALRWLGIRR